MMPSRSLDLDLGTERPCCAGTVLHHPGPMLLAHAQPCITRQQLHVQPLLRLISLLQVRCGIAPHFLEPVLYHTKHWLLSPEAKP